MVKSTSFCLLFCSFCSLYGACGRFDHNGIIHEILPNGILEESRFAQVLSNYIEVKNCSIEECFFVVRDEYYCEKCGCDSEDEYISSIKKIFGRTIKKDSVKRPYIYGDISVKMNPDAFYIGCNFLDINVHSNSNSVSAIFHPQKSGLCPVYMKFPRPKDYLPRYSMDGLYLINIKKEKIWKIDLDYYRPVTSYFIDDESEFTFYEKPLDMFIEPCDSNRCRFYSTEKIPQFKRNGNFYSKSVLLQNIKRFKPKCSFIKVEPSDNRLSSGFFIVDREGHCKIEIIHKVGAEKVISVQVLKDGRNFKVLLE